MNKVKAIIYDFDGTLTPDVCPQFAILEASGFKGGCSNPAFFPKVHEIAKRDHLDTYDAMVRHILDIVKSAGHKLTDENIALGADQRVYRPGVPEFLQKIKSSGLTNYLLSSGSKAYLEHTVIAPYFAKIYATTLHYDANGGATVPDYVMSTEAKIDALREVAQEFNGSPENCEGLVYIGDGPTDIPVMTYAADHHGVTIMLCDDKNQDEIQRVAAATGQPQDDIAKIVSHFFPADFREGSELDRFISSQI